MDIWTQIANEIKSHRKKRYWTQKDLGDKVGMSPQNISDLECARTTASIDRIETIAEALGCEAEITFTSCKKP